MFLQRALGHLQHRQGTGTIPSYRPRCKSSQEGQCLLAMWSLSTFLCEKKALAKAVAMHALPGPSQGKWRKAARSLWLLPASQLKGKGEKGLRNRKWTVSPLNSSWESLALTVNKLSPRNLPWDVTSSPVTAAPPPSLKSSVQKDQKPLQNTKFPLHIVPPLLH